MHQAFGPPLIVNNIMVSDPDQLWEQYIKSCDTCQQGISNICRVPYYLYICDATM